MRAHSTLTVSTVMVLSVGALLPGAAEAVDEVATPTFIPMTVGANYQTAPSYKVLGLDFHLLERVPAGTVMTVVTSSCGNPLLTRDFASVGPGEPPVVDREHGAINSLFEPAAESTGGAVQMAALRFNFWNSFIGDAGPVADKIGPSIDYTVTFSDPAIEPQAGSFPIDLPQHRSCPTAAEVAAADAAPQRGYFDEAAFVAARTRVAGQRGGRFGNVGRARPGQRVRITPTRFTAAGVANGATATYTWVDITGKKLGTGLTFRIPRRFKGPGVGVNVVWRAVDHEDGGQSVWFSLRKRR